MTELADAITELRQRFERGQVYIACCRDCGQDLGQFVTETGATSAVDAHQTDADCAGGLVREVDV